MPDLAPDQAALSKAASEAGAAAAAPLVSVVIPAHNAAATIGETIASVLGQTYRNFEILVVDDGSSDGTAELVARQAGPLRLVRQANQGLAAARRAGMERAQGQLIAWLDADDRYRPSMLAGQVAVLQARPEVVAVSTLFEAFDHAGARPDVSLTSYYSRLAGGPASLAALYPETSTLALADLDLAYRVGRLYPELLLGNVVHPPTLMFRRSAIARAGLPEPSLASGPDYHYLIRLARCGAFALILEPLLDYRLSPGQRSASANLGQIQRGIVTVLERALAEDPAVWSQFGPHLRRRLADVYGASANAVADTAKADALRWLAKAWRHGQRPDLPTLAKLALPRQAIRLVRRLRHS